MAEPKTISVSSTTKTFRDTAGLYTLTYPSNWKLTYPAAHEGVRSAGSQEPRTIVLVPPYAPKGSFGLSTMPMSKTTAMANIEQSEADKAHTITSATINGRDAYLARLVFAGPSNAEKYTDYYYIINADKGLLVAFRESYYHSYPTENWNDAKDLVGFSSIVHSVKFL